MPSDSQLSDLIGSRICHDLIGPLGAIGNGVELLTMSNADAPPELALISASVDSANARIRFFRVAFGAASAGARMGSAEVRSILSDVYRGSRLRIDWRSDADLPRGEVKLAFLLLQCLESALPWGGTVDVGRDEASAWRMTASGTRQKLDTALWDLVSNPQSESQVTASDVHFALVQPAAARLDRKVTADCEDTGITISF